MQASTWPRSWLHSSPRSFFYTMCKYHENCRLLWVRTLRPLSWLLTGWNGWCISYPCLCVESVSRQTFQFPTPEPVHMLHTLHSLQATAVSFFLLSSVGPASQLFACEVMCISWWLRSLCRWGLRAQQSLVPHTISTTGRPWVYDRDILSFQSILGVGLPFEPGGLLQVPRDDRQFLFWRRYRFYRHTPEFII